MQVVIVTPEATTLDVEAEFVSLPLIDGEIGVLKDHAPTIGRLGFGEMRVRTGNDTDRYFVDGGFVQISNDIVSVLTGKATPFADLAMDAVRSSLTAAESLPQSTTAETELRLQSINRASAQIKMLEKS
ncbi:MAG: ATP synthase F1 subunit epsilon [Planctomycetaceae bacterium]|nr:ATP synthase F1 subunit epsilon [Planctomycetaceae bacterium]